MIAKRTILLSLLKALFFQNIVGTFAFCNTHTTRRGQCSIRTSRGQRIYFRNSTTFPDIDEGTSGSSPFYLNNDGKSEEKQLKPQQESIRYNNEILPRKTNGFSSRSQKSQNKQKVVTAPKRWEPREKMFNRRIDIKLEPTTTFSRTKQSTPDLLTREEERELTNAIRRFQTLLQIREDLIPLKEIEKYNNLVATDNVSESEWAQTCGISVIQLRNVILHGKEANSKMIAANGGLVSMMAKKFIGSVQQANEFNNGMGTILTYQDLIQEGNIGIMEAAKRFDPDLGNKFCTYAIFWVRQRMSKAIYDYSRTIRLPPHVHQVVIKISKARKDLQQKNGRQATNRELAQHVGISLEKLEKYSDASRTVISLEQRIQGGTKQSSEDSRTLGDLIRSDLPTPNEDAEYQSMCDVLLSAVNELPGNERDILVGLYGLDGDNPKTTEEVSKQLGVARYRITAIKKRALNRLRRNPRQILNLKPYIEDCEIGEEINFGEKERKTKELTPEEIWHF